jgi:uroporphyrinogen-III synthase
MIPLIVIRPQPGAGRTLADACARGLDARAFPLFTVTPRAWEAPDPAEIDALLVGSANAVRYAGRGLVPFRSKPVHAVGEMTAAACRKAGLELVAVGRGGLQSVLDQVAPDTRLLRLAGEQRVKLEPPAGVGMIERIVYVVNSVPLPPDLVRLLGEPCVVALHSAAAARHFGAECDRLTIPREPIALVTIGPRVSRVAGDGWAALATAATPDDEALLACAAQLCQNRPGE